jgi:hypothetical protein
MTLTDELAELKKENLDLKITNRGKDYFIEQLQKEREGLIKQVVDSSQRVGQLEMKLLQLNSAPTEGGPVTRTDAGRPDSGSDW